MMMIFKPAIAIIALLLLSLSTNAYVTTIHIPAVLETQNLGNLTLVQLNVTPGTGGVQVNGPSSVDEDTISSARTAATYAASYLNLSETGYNFNYTIEDENLSVSGPSGGIALTLLAVAGLQHRQLAQDFTATGTIAADGSVGLIGGIFDKSGAAKLGGMRYILVPYAPSSSFEYMLYYISQQTRNLPIIEVANVSQAVKYAFGHPALTYLQPNLTQSYNLDIVGNTNITCASCNNSAFSILTNFTFDLVQGTELSISSNFSVARQQLLSNLDTYKQLVPEGYLYSAANLAFLDYINAFTLANADSYNASEASSLLENLSSYCSSLVPPPLTDSNYEFVIGGKLRQYWANITLDTARQLLINEQTTDDEIQSIRSAASADGWCSASDAMYTLAAEMGGSYVDVSPSLKTSAAAAISQARNYRSSIYSQTAVQAYNDGDYATALYAASYANVFGPDIPRNTSISLLYSQTLHNLTNITSGIWPTQFGAQSEFFFRQSVALNGSKAMDFALQAHNMAQLASALAADNAAISASFTATNYTAGSLQQIALQIEGLQESVTQIYWMLLLNAALLFFVLVVLLIHIISTKPRKRIRNVQK